MTLLRKSFLFLLIISVGAHSLCVVPESLWKSVSSNANNVVRWFNERPVAKYAALGALGSVLVAGSIYSWNGWTSNKTNNVQPQKPQEPKNDSQKSLLSVTINNEKKDEKEKRDGSFGEWYNKCKNLPFNVHSQHLRNYPTPLTWQSFKAVLDDFFVCTKQKDCMCDATAWIENKGNAEKFATLYASQEPLVSPFVQKVTLPVGSIVAFHGDFHGDIHSLMAYMQSLQKEGYLDGFKICNERFHMAFLGDYVDRGKYGSEVLYTIMRLKIANPDKVFLVRGNHEDVTIASMHGFSDEFASKFPSADTEEDFKYLSHMYDFLPSALYLGSGNDYLQCCHGGMEMGFDPKPLLASDKKVAFEWLGTLDELSKKAHEQYEEIASKNPEAERAYESNAIRTSYQMPSGLFGYGFMWNDFAVDQLAKIIRGRQGRGLEYPRTRTKQLLTLGSQAAARVRGVFRAHQHDNSLATPMMASILEQTDHQGVSKLWKPDNTHNQNLWDGIVCTFCVAPDSAYSNGGTLFNYDTYGILTMNGGFDSWKLDVRRNQIIS